MTSPDFLTVQRQFADAIRAEQAPDLSAIGVPDRRLSVYRELFFNNVVGFVSSTFPVLNSQYDEQQWLHMLRQFFIQHSAQSPYFVDISNEFLVWFSTSGQALWCGPYAPELAHYEWLELVVSVAKTAPETAINEPLSLMSPTRLQLSAAAQLVSYQFPVTQISAEFRPQTPLAEPVYLLLYRDLAFDVQFVELNALTMLALQQCQQQALSFNELAVAMQPYLPQWSLAQIAQALQPVLQPIVDNGGIVSA